MHKTLQRVRVQLTVVLKLTGSSGSGFDGSFRDCSPRCLCMGATRAGSGWSRATAVALEQQTPPRTLITADDEVMEVG